MTGSSSANGITTARALRIATPSVRARAGKSVSAAWALSRGRIAVARDTVITECGTITIRNVSE